MSKYVRENCDGVLTVEGKEQLVMEHGEGTVCVNTENTKFKSGDMFPTDSL
jgi:hypothetical protein